MVVRTSWAANIWVLRDYVRRANFGTSFASAEITSKGDGLAQAAASDLVKGAEVLSCDQARSPEHVMHQGVVRIIQAEDLNAGVFGGSLTAEDFLGLKKVVNKDAVNGKSNDPCVGLKAPKGAQRSF